ncbi:probable serine/threonine-protein kinase nek3 isoform X1 [Nasonia vitripennis]|uniref:Uncharacterized protein n=2 Tax=Nasonia vitripennis TaxID=7425 RepID=A0A7M7H605_NASVI|nr:probable serine/threonine-protein kinase nek3 isoform X1 [Nasonia vitripennis]
MLAYVCLLAFIGLGSSSEIEKVMPSRFEIESSINRTIEEVEKMIQDNPSLPKLSRADIVNILYNITAKDMHSIEDEALEALEKTRADYQRALMVVLPYKVKDSGENLDELYTKPPMVQMVADEASDPKKDSRIETVYNPSLFTQSNAQQSENLIENKHQLVTAHMRFGDSKKSKIDENKNLKSFSQVTTTTAKTLTNEKSEFEPQKFTFNLEALDQRAEASHTSIATKRPIYKGTFSRYRTSTQKPPKLEVIYSTTSKTTPRTTTTTEAQTETTTVLNKSTQNILSSDQWQYYAPPTTTTSRTLKPDDSPWKPMLPSKGFFLPTVSSDESDEPNFSILKMEDFEKVMQTTTTARPSPIFVTPSVTTHQKKVQSSIENTGEGFKLRTTTSSTVPPAPMREEVEQLLKSIGLQPIKPAKPQNDFKLDQNSLDALLKANFDNAKIKSTKFQTVKTDVLTPIKDNSFKAPTSSIKDRVKNLSPEIQLLFQQFGLQVPGSVGIPTTTTTTTTTPRPTIPTSVNSYTHFKPLPTAPVKDRDFRNFLARFGLGTGENRNQKAMQPKQVTKRPSLIEAVPENMKKILENIGLIRKAPKVEVDFEPNFEIQTQPPSFVELTTTPLNEHIFKPYEIEVNDKEQNEKIKNLLNTVRMVQEGKANVQDVQRVAHNLLQSTKSLASGPDPLKLEEILNNYRDNLKNEVKRQEEQTTTVASPTTEELDETALSSMATTDSSGSFSEISESSTSSGVDSKPSKADQSSSSSSTDEKAAKPSFFDTFDINAYLDNSTDTASSTETLSSSGSTSKPSVFDSIDAYIKMTASENAAKNANPSISDLEESFGGSTPEPDPVIPTRPKTGLYFLVDWNTFLEVGEEGKEKVNLRFAPKVGDRTRFIPVKVP